MLIRLPEVALSEEIAGRFELLPRAFLRRDAGHRADVRRGHDDVVVPHRAGTLDRAVFGVKAEAYSIGLERVDVPQPEIGEVARERTVNPERNPAVPLPRRVCFDHELVADPDRKSTRLNSSH